MSRVITRAIGLLAAVGRTLQDKSIEAAGGFLAPEKPNRELRRRMEREAKRERKAAKRAQAQKGTP